MSGDGWLRGPQWASPAAEAEWSDRLAAAAAAWEELEALSITAGIREAALTFLSGDELVRATADASIVGLQVVPLAVQGNTVRAAVCRPALAARWVQAWRAGDDDAIGAMLGFPECCRDFFRIVWGQEGARDTTDAMASADGPAGPPFANIFLRRLGVRLVPHLPCSFLCEASVERGRRFYEAGIEAGVEDADEILRLLDLPVTWSAVNGAAVVDVGGVLRFSYETDLRPPVLLKRPGGEARALVPPAWRDNGFKSRAAMEAAHAIVAATVGAAGSGIDLGAGDGTLLERVRAGRAGDWYAVEADEERAARGFLRRPQLRFISKRIEAADIPAVAADVALLMPGRLLEMDHAAAARVREQLPKWARRLVVYGYGDALPEGGLAQLFAWSKIPGRLGTVNGGPNVQAAEVML